MTTMTFTTGNDTLTVPAGPGTYDLTFLAGADTLTGAGGDDILNGGTGADAMAGGTGNDIYFVDNAGDVVTELAGQGTADLVKSTISWSLGANVENLTLFGAAAINGTGNA